MSRKRVQKHKPVRELHNSAITPPLLFSVASTTKLVGRNIFTSFVDRHKNMNFSRLAWRLNKSAFNSANACIESKGRFPRVL